MTRHFLMSTALLYSTPAIMAAILSACAPDQSGALIFMLGDAVSDSATGE
jgi:hypothetical protein